MKKISYILLFLLGIPFVSYGSDIDDDSIIKELDKNNTQELEVDFSLKSFDSCQAFEDVMEDYLKMYWENSYKDYGYYRG